MVHLVHTTESEGGENNYRISDTGELLVRSATLGSAGTYTCQVRVLHDTYTCQVRVLLILHYPVIGPDPAGQRDCDAGGCRVGEDEDPAAPRPAHRAAGEIPPRRAPLTAVLQGAGPATLSCSAAVDPRLLIGLNLTWHRQGSRYLE